MKEGAVEKFRQFLKASSNNLGLDDNWTVESVDLLEEAAKEHGLHKYMKFKCVATSERCRVFPGLVFTKTPVHEKMPTVISETHLLLWESLDMNKEDKDSVCQTYKLLDEYPANMVVVEGSVSEEYQDYFLSRGMTAVQDMKHRLQRFPSLGFSCTSLECIKKSENLNHPINEKPLMFLEGCESLTFLLKGSSTAELKLKKRILKTGYNRFRNELLSSNYFLVALPPLKITPWEMDGGQDEVVTIREEEVSSYIAYSLQQVQDESSEYSFICQHRDSFQELRKSCNMTEAQYISSLSRCDRWEAKGGKSGALFAKSRDTRLIIKEINQAEFESFENFGPMYFEYMKEAKKTFLAKIYGLYKFLMAMENLNLNRSIAAQYDLKGLVHGRLAPDSAQVRLDQNFVNDMKRSRLHINPYSKQDLQTAIRKDTDFLSGINVMDYSLLVGVDRDNHEFGLWNH